MKIYILTENNASAGFIAEHGLSYLIEHDVDVLFDTGATDVFLQNANLLNKDLRHVKTVVLSHGHWDHGNGLKYIKDKKLICHPGAFQKRYSKARNKEIGIDIPFNNLSDKFEIVKTAKPHPISKNIIFLGEIPRLTSFESQTTFSKLDDETDDFIMDDSGLVIKHNNEIIVISGCAHSGICNIVEYAKQVTGIQKIRAVIGGFHLKYNDLQTQETIEYFKNQDIKELYPSHCTELPVLTALYEEYKFKQLKTGMVLEF